MLIFDVACELWLDDDLSSTELKHIACLVMPKRWMAIKLCNFIDAVDCMR